jgi:hypothetical protein
VACSTDFTTSSNLRSFVWASFSLAATSGTDAGELQEVAAFHGVVHVLGQCAGGGEGGPLVELGHHHADDVAPLVHQRAAGVAGLDGRADLEMPRVILRPGEAGNLPFGQLGRTSFATRCWGNRRWCMAQSRPTDYPGL